METREVEALGIQARVAIALMEAADAERMATAVVTYAVQIPSTFRESSALAHFGSPCRLEELGVD